MRIKHVLAEEIGDALDADVTAQDIEEPPSMEQGDYAFPVMGVADNPRDAAEAAGEELAEVAPVDRVEVAGPGYLNVFLDRAAFADQVAKMLSDSTMGVEQQSGKMLIEFSQPNIAKPMHVGHLRNNCLGDALQRIMRFCGYDVTSDNYIGDVGTQFGKVIYGHRNFDVDASFDTEPMEYMLDIYVKFHEKVEETPEIEEEAAEWTKKIEEGDEEAVELWEKFREASIEYQKEEYERLGVEFDRISGESTVMEESRQLILELVEEGVLDRDEDGSVFYEFDEEDLPGTVLLRSDGATLYLTRDIYNLKKRKEEGFDYNLYVVASEQELHFKQLFQIAEDLGIAGEGFQSEHLSYGMLSLPDGSMSTREGRVVRQSDVLDEAVERASEKAEEGLERTVTAAEKIGIGAVKYAVLEVSRNKDIEFDWDRVLSFEGDSGPYLQYANTRAKSILEDAEQERTITGEVEDAEHRLVKQLAAFPELVEQAARQREPAKLANYLSRLSETFNAFYHSKRVLDAETDTAVQRRLELVELFRDVTDQGLNLLGIDPLEEM